MSTCPNCDTELEFRGFCETNAGNWYCPDPECSREVIVTTAESKGLLPCPFCASKPSSTYIGDHDGGYWAVWCETCNGGESAFIGVHLNTQEEAESIWNTRSHDGKVEASIIDISKEQFTKWAGIAKSMEKSTDPHINGLAQMLNNTFLTYASMSITANNIHHVMEFIDEKNLGDEFQLWLNGSLSTALLKSKE